jgi:hypothetical protein
LVQVRIGPGVQNTTKGRDRVQGQGVRGAQTLEILIKKTRLSIKFSANDIVDTKSFLDIIRV